MRSARGSEVNPVGKPHEQVQFEDVGYTRNPDIADYYRSRTGIIAVEEVEEEE